MCGQIIAAAAGPGDEVLYAWRSFEAYPIWTQISGATSVQVPLLPDERHDLEAMLAADHRSHARRLRLQPEQPHGPGGDRGRSSSTSSTGCRTTSSSSSTRRTGSSSPGTTSPDGIELFRRYPNVVVLRTFSKAYGLAALRVGFAIAHERVAEALRKTATPFGVSTIAEEAAIASLDAEDELLARVRHLVDERDPRVGRAARPGLDGAPHRGQLRVAAAGRATRGRSPRRARRPGITVRPFAGEGVRITIAEQEANDRVIEVARTLRGRLG